MKYLIILLLFCLISCDNAHSGLIYHDASIPLTLPTERELPSSEPLVLAGVRIYYGTSPGMYDTKAEFTDLSTSTFTITGLLNNPYYVVATVYDDAGRESMYSNEVVIPIAIPLPKSPIVGEITVN